MPLSIRDAVRLALLEYPADARPNPDVVAARVDALVVAEADRDFLLEIRADLSTPEHDPETHPCGVCERLRARRAFLDRLIGG